MPFEQLLVLTDPPSVEAFGSALGSLCREAGAHHFLAVRLRGVHLDDVVQVIHDAPRPDLVEGMRHWSLQRLLDTMRTSPLPAVFGAGAMPGPEVPGFSSGVAALAREPRGAVVIVFGLNATEAPSQAAGVLIQSALLAAHHSIDGLRQLHAAACPLSDRELQCLELAFTGELSSREIGQRLNISARTVEHYLEQGRAKLGVDTTIAAGVQAVNKGWMDLPSSGPIEVTG